MSELGKKFEELVSISRHLRGPDGCPWDRKQTLETIKSYIVEEAYEVIQAIEEGDDKELIEELGDLLYQVVFVSQIKEEEGAFGIYEVIAALCEKLIRRHPHVFGDMKAKNAEEAVRRWHSEKLKEKGRKKRLLEIPRSMPSVMRAQRIGEKVSQVGFDWSDVGGVVEKLREELSELEKEIEKGDREGIEKEWGDLFFTLVNLGRFLKLDTENVAHKAIDKFVKRFSLLEDKAKKEGKEISSISTDEMNVLWEKIKEEI